MLSKGLNDESKNSIEIMDLDFYKFCVKRMRQHGDGVSPRPELLIMLRDDPDKLKRILVETDALVDEATSYCITEGVSVRSYVPDDANYLIQNLPITFKAEIESLPPPAVSA